MNIEYKKVHTRKDIVISLIVIAAGIGAFFFNAAVSLVILFCGVMMLLFYRSGFRSPEGIVMKKIPVDLSSSCRQSLLDFLSGKSPVLGLVKTGNGAAIRLEVYYSDVAGEAHAHLFDFRDYTYVEATEPVVLRGENCAVLMGELKKLGVKAV